MFSVRIYDKISEAAIDQELPPSRYRCNKSVAYPEAVLVRSRKLSADDIGLTTLAVARAGTGVDNIPVEEVTLRGMPVFNSPGANANSVAELTLSAILMSARYIPNALDFMHGLQEEVGVKETVEKQKSQFKGREIRGSKLGILGLGAIGGLVAEKAIALGMIVCGYDPELTVRRAVELPSGLHLANSIDEVVRASHFVTLHVPLIEGVGGTRAYFGTDYIGNMTTGTELLNFARGEVIDETAVLKALKNGTLGGYYTDFVPQEVDLRSHPGVVVLPHLGASTNEAEEAAAEIALRNLRDYLENGNVVGAVNFPSVSMSRTTRHRITVAHRNIADVIARITSELGAELNLEDFVDRSRGELAYVIFDVSAEPNSETMQMIGDINGVLKARYVPQLD